MFEIHAPTDKPSITAELERLEGEIGDYFAELSPEEFVTPQGEAWSPGGCASGARKAPAGDSLLLPCRP